MEGYLEELKFSPQVGKDAYIPEKHLLAVRAVTLEGEPWFVASDVCRVLGLEQTHKALNRLDEDEVGRGIKIPHPQSPEKTIEVGIVNEPGLYSLVLASHKPEAKAFKRWITHEVIPSIRKTGGYIAGQETIIPTSSLRA